MKYFFQLFQKWWIDRFRLILVIENIWCKSTYTKWNFQGSTIGLFKKRSNHLICIRDISLCDWVNVVYIPYILLLSFQNSFQIFIQALKKLNHCLFHSSPFQINPFQRFFPFWSLVLRFIFEIDEQNYCYLSLFSNDVEQCSPSHHHHFRKSRMYNFISIQHLQITLMSFPHSSLYWEMRKTMLSDFCSSICRQFMRFYICKVKFCYFIQNLLLLIEISEDFYLKKLIF